MSSRHLLWPLFFTEISSDYIILPFQTVKQLCMVNLYQVKEYQRGHFVLIEQWHNLFVHSIGLFSNLTYLIPLMFVSKWHSCVYVKYHRSKAKHAHTNNQSWGSPNYSKKYTSAGYKIYIETARKSHFSADVNIFMFECSWQKSLAYHSFISLKNLTIN